MPGLGAGEGIMRRAGLGDLANYWRRNANAEQMFADRHARVRAWLSGDAVPASDSPEGDLLPSEVDESRFEVVRDNFIVPSYAMMLKAYQLYLQGGSPESAFRSLAAFARELFGRGAREVLLGALLLAGNPTGREMALNIMKLHQEKDPAATFDALWNTSFDLTYSRVATMPSLPEHAGLFALPCIFVTDDKHLGKFLGLVHPVGAMGLARGGGVTADQAHLSAVLQEDMVPKVAKIVAEGNAQLRQDQTSVEEVSRIRRYRSRKYIEQLEAWFTQRVGS